MTTLLRAERYRRSTALLDRARKVIPGGVWGHNRFPSFLFPGDYPYFANRAAGAHLFDVDGNRYIDYLCGYGAMITGFANPHVDRAAYEQAQLGDCMDLPTEVSVALAETLCSLVRGADWCAFGKNGSDAVSTAVLIARARTGRRRVVCVRNAYHGSHFWCNWCNPGTGRPGDDSEAVLQVTWNDEDELAAIFEAHGREIAALVATPFHHPIGAEAEMPSASWWSSVEQACRASGALLIEDDVRTGYRLDLAGSHVFFGFQPDLVCQSKALANTHPLSVVLGTDGCREAAESVFAAGTFWSASAPMAAALENLRQLQANRASPLMWDLGTRLAQGLTERAARVGLELRVSGPATIPTVTLAGDVEGHLMARFAAAMVERGSFVHPSHNWFVSAAHTAEDIDATLGHAEAAFEEVLSGAAAGLRPGA